MAKIEKVFEVLCSDIIYPFDRWMLKVSIEKWAFISSK
jgi:hypothetical protein